MSLRSDEAHSRPAADIDIIAVGRQTHNARVYRNLGK